MLTAILTASFFFTLYVLHPSVESMISYLESDKCMNESDDTCRFYYSYLHLLCSDNINFNCKMRMLGVLSKTSKYGKVDQIEWHRIFIFNRIDKFNILKNGKTYDPSIHNNMAIRLAIEHRRIELIKELLKDPRTDISSDNCGMLRFAYFIGNLEIINLLCDARINGETCHYCQKRE